MFLLLLLLVLLLLSLTRLRFRRLLVWEGTRGGDKGQESIATFFPALVENSLLSGPAFVHHTDRVSGDALSTGHWSPFQSKQNQAKATFFKRNPENVIARTINACYTPKAHDVALGVPREAPKLQNVDDLVMYVEVCKNIVCELALKKCCMLLL